MSTDLRLERSLPRILDDLGAHPDADYVDDILAAVSRTDQRSAWSFPTRWLPLEITLGGANRYWLRQAQVVVLLALLVVIATVAAVVAGSRPKVPTPFGPAANGLITYGSNGDIFAGNPIDGTSRPIVDDPGTYDYLPFYAPDGIQIAFFRALDGRAAGQTQLVVVRDDGSGMVLPKTPQLDQLPWAAVWAPDSRTIAMITKAQADGQLLMVDATGSVDARVVDVPGMTADGIAFAPPDGQRMLFRGNLGRDIGLFTARDDGSDLVALIPPFDGAEQADMTWPADRSLVAELRNPVYSPDGRRVAYTRYALNPGVQLPDLQDVGVAQGATNGRRPRIFVMNSDGSGSPAMVGYTPGDVADAWPAWSPDGTKIAFMRDRTPTTLGTDQGQWHCAVVDLESGVVTETGPLIADGQASLAWAPDGSHLIVVQHSSSQSVWLLDPNGGPERVMPWSPEAPGLWTDNALRNGLDPGSYQRLVSP
jgi:Tol biopolymer transport system component